MRPSAWSVAGFFAVLAVVMTWPLVTVMGSAIAIDLGDPVFVCWVMLWTGGQLLKFLQGDFSALGDYWNGNIFYPEQLTIAYSEHFAPQMLQALPVYAVTGNIVLAYNLLFLSTFVLSGLGMFLLVREVTGKPLPALLAGVAFAFAPYRMGQLPHLAVISSQWMPFALYGFRRYFVSGQLRPLAGAAASIALQILSCGYYLLFFAPFAALYCAYEMVKRRLITSRRTWVHLGVAWAAAGAVVAPFLWPYLGVRDIAGVGVRPLEEVLTFSADVWAFATAPQTLRLWGERLALFPKPEGAGFPGFTILLFLLIGIATGIFAILRRAKARPALFGFSLFAFVVSAVLALGPRIEWHGEAVGTGPYLWLYRYVPGFDGVRVPARFLMITTLFAAALAGIGAAAMAERWRRAGAAIIALGIAGMLAESWSVPLGSNQRLWIAHYDLAPRHLATDSTIGAVYSTVRDLPAGTILAEFPFGAAPFDIQASFYAGFHRKPLINGYSGFFPASFNARFATLGGDPVPNGAAAWQTLLDAGVTHVVVHEAAYFRTKGQGVSNWLRAAGARELIAQGRDRLFALR